MPSSLLYALAAAALADAAAPRRPAGREPPHRPLRIVTYNVHAWRCSGHRDNYERVEAALRELDPDILCLNEVLHPFLAPPPDHPYWRASANHATRGYAPPAGTLSETDASLSRTHLHRLARMLGLDHVAFAPATTRGSFFGDYPFGNAICSRCAPTRRPRHAQSDARPRGAGILSIRCATRCCASRLRTSL